MNDYISQVKASVGFWNDARQWYIGLILFGKVLFSCGKVIFTWKRKQYRIKNECGKYWNKKQSLAHLGGFGSQEFDLC